MTTPNPNPTSTETAGRLIFAVLSSFPELASLSSQEIGMRMAVGIVREFSEPDASREEAYDIITAALTKATAEADKVKENTGPQWLDGVRD